MSGRCWGLVLALLVCTGLTGCGRRSSSPPAAQTVVLPDSPWPSFRGNRRNTGQGVGGGARGKLKWTFSTPQSPNCICSTPAIGEDGTVYIAIRGRDDYLYALDSSGHEKWSTDIAQFKSAEHGHVASELAFDVSSPAIGIGGMVYVGSDDHHLYAVRGKDGEVAWIFDAGADILSSPNVGPDGTVYFASQNGRIYALDGIAGKVRWMRRGAVAYTPAVGDDGTAYFGVKGSLEARSGSGDSVRSLPIGSCTDWVVDGDRAFVRGNLSDGNVAAVDLKTGRRLWSFTTGMDPSDLAASKDGTVYAGDAFGQNGKLYALDGKTGQPKWHFDHFIGNHPPAIDAKGDVYLIVAPKVLALDGMTGKVKWRLNLKPSPWFSPMVIDREGTVYVGTSEGKLYAIE